jgi:TPR repeat protein
MSPVGQNLSESGRYYRMSADLGNADGQVHYGIALENGDGVAKNLSEAAKYYKMSAHQGNAVAQSNYGIAHGTIKARAKTVYFFRLELGVLIQAFLRKPASSEA